MSNHNLCVVLCLITLAAAFMISLGLLAFNLPATLILAAFFYVLAGIA